MTRELQSIYRIVQAGYSPVSERNPIVSHRIRVRTGILEGIEGSITDQQEATRLFFMVKFLNATVSIPLNDTGIELIPETPLEPLYKYHTSTVLSVTPDYQG